MNSVETPIDPFSESLDVPTMADGCDDKLSSRLAWLMEMRETLKDLRSDAIKVLWKSEYYWELGPGQAGAQFKEASIQLQKAISILDPELKGVILESWRVRLRIAEQDYASLSSRLDAKSANIVRLRNAMTEVDSWIGMSTPRHDASATLTDDSAREKILAEQDDSWEKLYEQDLEHITDMSNEDDFEERI